MYHFNSLIFGIGGMIWGTTILLSCNRPHTTQMDEPAIHNLEADIHQNNNEGDTALHVAVQRGDAVAVNTLLLYIPEADRLALIQQHNNNGNTAIHDAAIIGHAAVVNTLLIIIPEADRIALIQQSNNHGETALHIAEDRGHAAVINILRNLDADVH